MRSREILSFTSAGTYIFISCDFLKARSQAAVVKGWMAKAQFTIFSRSIKF